MGRHNRRTVAKFVTAASVLAVLFAAFFAVSDVLPIPDDFREILGLASADTTGVGEFDLESEVATSSTSQLPSVESSGTAGIGDSADASATAELSSEETSPTDSAVAGADDPPAAPADSDELAPAASSSSVQQPAAVPPSFPSGALIVFRYPTASGFTVGYSAALDGDSVVDHYNLLIERIQALGSDDVLSSMTTSTTAEEYAASGLLPGAYRVTVTAVDEVNAESAPLVGEVLVGHARPQVTVSFVDPSMQAAVASGDWINWGSTVQLAIAVETEAPFFKIHSTDLLGAAAVTASIESSTTTSTLVSIAGEGQRVISVSAVDCYGLESTPTAIALKVDRTAPTAVALLRAVQPAGTDELRVSWVRSFDPTSGISHYVVEVTDTDGTVVERVRRSVFANPYYRFTDLDFGYYDISVTPVDVAGNAGPTRMITSELSEEVAADGHDADTASGSGSTPDDSGDSDGETPSAGPATPSVPATEPADQGSTPSRPIDTKINDSNRLYWLIGAVGFGIGLLMIYFTAVHRAFSKKSNEL